MILQGLKLYYRRLFLYSRQKSDDILADLKTDIPKGDTVKLRKRAIRV